MPGLETTASSAAAREENDKQPRLIMKYMRIKATWFSQYQRAA